MEPLQPCLVLYLASISNIDCTPDSHTTSCVNPPNLGHGFILTKCVEYFWSWYVTESLNQTWSEGTRPSLPNLMTRSRRFRDTSSAATIPPSKCRGSFYSCSQSVHNLEGSSPQFEDQVQRRPRLRLVSWCEAAAGICSQKIFHTNGLR